MKKILLSFILVLITSISFSQSIPNGGFESWIVNSYENPQFFETSNYGKDNGVQNLVNATKTTDAYQGSFAIKLTSSLGVPTGTSFAYFANGNPGSNPTGGIPYSQKPTGIKFFYKSNIMPTDTAIFITIFKKAGAVVGNYFYKIATTHTAYTVFNQTFNPALPIFPDTVIVACASSNAFTGNAIPGNSIQLDSISFTGVAFQPTNFNGNFESWQTETDYKLNGWNLSGGFQRTNDFHTGNYALELQTNPPAFGDNQIQVGRATTGIPTQNNTLGGTPYSGLIDTMFFYYKYLPSNPVDSARIYVNFKKNFVYTSNVYALLPVAPVYTLKKIPWNLGVAPDTMVISIESSKWPVQNSYVGADFKIDNMYLKSQMYTVSNYTMPTTGCVGQAIQLSDNSTNMPSAWNWIMPGGSPSSSILQSPIVTFNSPGTKTITMNAGNQFGSGASISKTITIYSVPGIAATSILTCGGGSVTLNASGANTYTWSTGQNSQNITVSASNSITTNYTVTGTTGGCSNTAIGSVIIPFVEVPSICLVTVDSLGNNNVIYWEKTLYDNVDSFIVYREIYSNVYKRIAAVSKNAFSGYTDTARSIGPANGDPNTTSYKYKLQIRDTCGHYGVLSKWHQTLFIQDQQNGNFNWNSYAVENSTSPVTVYDLYRINLSNNTYTLVTSSTAFLATDPQYGIWQTTGRWRIEANGFNCNPTNRINGILSQKVKTKSNIKNDRLVGLKNYDLINASINTYPSPAKDILFIDGRTLANIDFSIEFRNTLGQVLYSKNYTAGSIEKYQIDLSAFANGIYFVNIKQENKTLAAKKIIVNK
ncbi:MAG: T9SS type A sorting domain-containing protein [Bacteroidetes bacterium]|nr:T9SS type A sorting domain-containing protein [Bacteroidota bacterium]